jgi:acyl transferase domain-containing protein
MAGRFPGAESVDEFWRNICGGIESIAPVSAPYGSKRRPQARVGSGTYVPAAGLLKGIELFDADFFKITPHDAEIMDPQHRVFLECAWEALEHAGYDVGRVRSRVGVFAGMGVNDYADRVRGRNPNEFSVRLGTAADFLATRVSHKLNLTGPSVIVQTACSTSLVAVCFGCQSLVDYQSDVVLAGAVSIADIDQGGYFSVTGGILSPDARCRAFDAAAAGTVPASGVGIVVLKRLQDALDDGDFIHSVIIGWAVNNDGATKGGFTAPSEGAQTDVIAEALALAGVDSESIGLIEAHGTGTRLGDAIEVAALTNAFRAQTVAANFCALGSVKTNIGHADTAAGVAGLMKATMAVRDGILPPSLHFEAANPALALESSPFFVNTMLRPWAEEKHPRRAGVSSFGIGGTNAHVVVEAPPPTAASVARSGSSVLVLSAPTRSALKRIAANLASYLDSRPDADLDSVSYTLQTGRRVFSCRTMAVCHDRASAISALTVANLPTVSSPDNSDVAFMFPGQGGHRTGATAELYRGEAAYARQIDECATLLRSKVEWDLTDALGLSCNMTEAVSILQQTAVAQPALFAVEYGLAKLWESWGVRPSALIGHSVGEYAAACLAGVMSLEDALAILVERGRLMQSMAPGAMLAVRMGEADLRKLLDGSIDLAAVNAPDQCVVAGPSEAVTLFERRLVELAVPCRRLTTDRAFHSRSVDLIAAQFTQTISRYRLQPPRIPLISNVTGGWMREADATDPSYWARQMRETVCFHDGLSAIAGSGPLTLLEIGPAAVLAPVAARHPAVGGGYRVVTTLDGARKGECDQFFSALGELWLAGTQIDWTRAGSRRPIRVPLPTYPFDRKRFWPDAPAGDRPAVPEPQPGGYWLGLPQWKRCISAVQSSASDGLPGICLLFVDASLFGAVLADRLTAAGWTVVCVKRGTSFGRRPDNSYVIRCTERDDYDRLLTDLVSRASLPRHVVHLWSFDHNESDDPSAFTRCQELSLYSVLLLRQVLLASSIAGKVSMTVLATGLCDIDGPACPEKMPLAAACRVMSQENPDLPARVLDTGRPPADPAAAERYFDNLVREITGEGADLVVAYRGVDRFVPSLEPINNAGIGMWPSLLREGGTYVIIGGLGLIGLQIAEHISRLAATKLVLIGRTRFPERGSWDRWLTGHHDQDSISTAIRGITACESRGSQVLLSHANVADESALGAALRAATRAFGRIHGIVHAAGIVAGPSIAPVAKLSPQLCEVQFRAKAYGLFVLERVIEDYNLDFCLVLSSLSALLGGIDLMAYAAANAFVDGFVQRHNRLKAAAWTAVDLDGWVRDGIEPASAPTWMPSTAVLTSEVGIRALDAVLRLGPVSRIVVARQDPRPRFTRWLNVLTQPDRGFDRAAPGAAIDLQHLQRSSAEADDLIVKTVISIWEPLFGIKGIAADGDFFAMGGDSLMGIQLLARLNERFGVRLGLQSLFDHPTPAGIGAKLRAASAQRFGSQPLQAALAELNTLSEEEALKALRAEDLQRRYPS